MMRRGLIGAMLALGLVAGVWVRPVAAQDLTTMLSKFLRDLAAGNIGATVTTLTGITFSGDAGISRTAAATLAVGNGTLSDTSGVLSGASFTASASMVSALYRSTVAKVLFRGIGTGPTQLASTQTTAPTCTTNCGTPGNVCVGTDSDMICTMGTTPASGFVVAFNASWAAAPACIGQMALAGMVAGKAPLTMATTVAQITVVTNGTAPVAGDLYAINCRGTQ